MCINHVSQLSQMNFIKLKIKKQFLYSNEKFVYQFISISIIQWKCIIAHTQHRCKLTKNAKSNRFLHERVQSISVHVSLLTRLMLKGFKTKGMNNAIYEINNNGNYTIAQENLSICKITNLHRNVRSSVRCRILNIFFFRCFCYRSFFGSLAYFSSLFYCCCNLRKYTGSVCSVDMVGCYFLFFSSIYYCLPWFWEVLANEKYTHTRSTLQQNDDNIEQSQLLLMPPAARTN